MSPPKFDVSQEFIGGLLGEAPAPVVEEPRGGLLARAGRTLGLREEPEEEIPPGLIETGAELLTGKAGIAREIRETLPSIPRGLEHITYPETEEEEGFQVHDLVNFLVGDEMAIIGFKYDSTGFGHDWEIAKRQWAEQPLWVNLLATTSLVGTIAFPALKATSIAKFGKFGESLLGFSKAKEISKYKQLGAIAEDVADVDDGTLRTLRKLEHVRTKYAESVARKKNIAETGGTRIERLKDWFDRSFSNSYMEQISDEGRITGRIKPEFAKRMEDFWKNEELGQFFVNVPGEELGPAVYAHWLKKIDPSLDLPSIARGIDPNYNISKLNLDEPTKIWADRIFDAKVKHQEQALSEAFITQDTYNRIGIAHVPAFDIGTPMPEAKTVSTFVLPLKRRTKVVKPKEPIFEAGEVRLEPTGEEYIALKTFEFPTLNAAQMEHRKKDLPEIARRLFEGKLITDPADVSYRGFVTDRMLLFNHIFTRDLIMRDAKRSSDILSLYGSLGKAEKAGWISLDKYLGKGNVQSTIRRMLNHKNYGLSEDEPLPYLHKAVVEELFGENGIWAQAEGVVGLLEATTMLHKVSKTGFCLVEGTRILTDKGYLRIEEAFEYKPGFNFNISNSPKVWSPVLENWENILASYYSQEEECMKVTLKDGSEIEGTLEHPIMSNGKLIKLKELKVGDIIDQYIGGNFPKNKIKVPWNVWKDEVDKTSKVEIEIDEDISELIGWIIGDGGKHNKNSIRISIGKDYLNYSINRLKELCDRLGIKYCVNKDKRDNRNIWYFEIHNYRLVNLLNYLGVFWEDKRQINVPEFVFMSPKSIICSFLRGLLDTDGSVTNKTGMINISSVSKQLIKDIHLLLKWLGIRPSIAYEITDQTLRIDGKMYEYKDYEYWIIRFNSNKSKKIIIENELFGIPDKFNCVKNSITNTYNRHFKNKVEKIERTGIKPVYDISINDPHLFVAEGIINHNSIPTHFQNLFGTFSFLLQAGYNPLSPKNVNTMHALSKVFQKWAGHFQTSRKAGINPRQMLDPLTGKIKGLDLGRLKIGDKEFDLNQELLNPMVRDIIEESAFTNVEALGKMEDLMRTGRMKKSALLLSKGMLALKDSSKLTQKTMDAMTTAYLGEDMVPKMAYYLNLRAKGLNPEWAAIEVGRRLPMYSTSGSLIREGRRLLVPWISFPSEAMRITKNNLMDHPMRMLPWLYLPSLLQTGMSMTGIAPGSFGEVQERKRQLPLWAQTPTTVVAEGPGGSRFGAGVAAGAAGLAVGGLRAGAKGAYLGAAIGASLGVAASKFIEDDKESSNVLRGAILNWLPHSAFLPQNTSPEYIWDLQGIMNAAPAEPLGILRPLVEIMSGRTAFGQEIGGENTLDELGKMMAGYIGFISPPLMQRYGFRTTTPDISVSESLLGKKIPGDPTNVSRLLIETGQTTDTMTGKPGSLTFDFMVNNLLGMWKSYAINPEARLINEGRTQKKLSETRSFLTRKLSYHIENGNDAVTKDILGKVFATFSKQYSADPGLAQKKFTEWMIQHMKEFGRHPLLRTWSEEELMTRFLNASSFAERERSRARDDIMESIRRELLMRKLQ